MSSAQYCPVSASAGEDDVQEVTAEEAVHLQQSKKKRKQPYRFNEERDLMLLREAVATNPWGSQFASFKEGIAELTKKLGGEMQESTVRDRLVLLLENFEKEEKKSLRRSGVAEEHGEKEQLLQDCIELRNERVLAKEKLKSEKDAAAQREKELAQQGRQICDAALQNLVRSPAPAERHQQKAESSEKIRRNSRGAENSSMECAITAISTYITAKQKREEESFDMEKEVKALKAEKEALKLQLEIAEMKKRLARENALRENDLNDYDGEF
jgi:hypothetical protein